MFLGRPFHHREALRVGQARVIRGRAGPGPASLGPQVAKGHVPPVARVALDLSEGDEDQLQLAHVRLHPHLAGPWRDEAQVQRDAAVPGRLLSAVGRVEPVLDSDELRLRVVADGLQAVGQARGRIEGDALAADVDQEGRVLPVRPDHLLHRPRNRLQPRKFGRPGPLRVVAAVRHEALRVVAGRKQAAARDGPCPRLGEQDRVDAGRLRVELVQAVHPP
eukprot:CAMPEP_0172173606 /NCGR_PEP_ID=MMETSP1050-20130122/13158_1 /TAXON_ID=233186 /ORGANISM="Cryptomonas curvata, Strain CCAP979/52" /LENGTH=219 /DNA_ID=CAMNT_0012845401 /DNA_START=220 /DNA_END=875 /DNA_ORIENTATION=+